MKEYEERRDVSAVVEGAEERREDRRGEEEGGPGIHSTGVTLLRITFSCCTTAIAQPVLDNRRISFRTNAGTVRRLWASYKRARTACIR